MRGRPIGRPFFSVLRPRTARDRALPDIGRRDTAARANPV